MLHDRLTRLVRSHLSFLTSLSLGSIKQGLIPHSSTRGFYPYNMLPDDPATIESIETPGEIFRHGVYDRQHLSHRVGGRKELFRPDVGLKRLGQSRVGRARMVREHPHSSPP